jgi:AcrR family transcriptional regulator
MSNKESSKSKKEARVPVQERAAARMAKVLEAAERMLESVGPVHTSIPALAEASGVPRAAIYPFFPDKYALYSHLARTHMERLTEALATPEAARAKTWRIWVDAAVRAAADYYNDHPVASILLLSGIYADGDSDVHAAKNTAVGSMFRANADKFEELRKLPTAPDVAMIAVEIAFACMRHGYSQDGKVSLTICDEATRAVTAYLAHWSDPS